MITPITDVNELEEVSGGSSRLEAFRARRAQRNAELAARGQAISDNAVRTAQEGSESSLTVRRGRENFTSFEGRRFTRSLRVTG